MAHLIKFFNIVTLYVLYFIKYIFMETMIVITLWIIHYRSHMPWNSLTTNNKTRIMTLQLYYYNMPKQKRKVIYRYFYVMALLSIKSMCLTSFIWMYIYSKGSILYLCWIHTISQICTSTETSMTLLNFKKGTLW